MDDRCPVALDPTGRDIHAEAARLRAAGPATPVTLPGGVIAWSVNSYAIAKKLFTDPNVTKSARSHWPAFRNGEIPPDWELISWVAMDNMVTAYGKDHIRLRRMVGKAFTPRRTEEIRPRIVELTNELITALATVPPGEVVDLRERFAYPLPARLVADLIGMSETVRAKTASVIDMMVDTTVTPEQAQAVLDGWRGAMSDFIAAKRANPGEDITSDLIAAKDIDGAQLTESELTDTIFAILGAGSETTINFFDNAITALLSNTEQRRLIASGQVNWDDVIDETLRLESPLAHLPLRYAVEDIVLDTVTIPKGSPILINYAAIGRDPGLHSDAPDTFDLQRADKEHLSFGHGPHYCLGAGVARLVATIGLSTLFERFPAMELAVSKGELTPLPTFIMNGHRSLPVRLTPARVAPADATSAVPTYPSSPAYAPATALPAAPRLQPVAVSFRGPSAADQAAVWAVPQRIVNAWEANDAAAFAATFAEDGTMILPGVFHTGRDAIRNYMTMAFKGPLKGTRVTGQPINIKFLNENAMLLITRGGVLAPGESQVSDLRAIRATWLIVKQDDEWLLTSYQNSPAAPV